MKTTYCPYCGVGCGLKFSNNKLFGDNEHISTNGNLCKKPLYLPQVIGKSRLTKALFRGNKDCDFTTVNASDAIELISKKISTLRADECYFYISGQLGTEDCYVINKFVKGYLGTNNIDANSRLCMASAVSAYKISFGSDGPPASYSDIDNSETLLFVGSNASITHPVLFKRALQAQKSGAKIVVIDPVKSETAQKADHYMSINCGTDTVLFNAILSRLINLGLINEKFIKDHTSGFENLMDKLRNINIKKSLEICGISEKEFSTLLFMFVSSKKLMSFWCQGLNQSSNAVAKNLSLINLHLATGRVGATGYPFSLTGQPNAMGGREVGYLTNGLPGYRDVRESGDREFCESYWGVKKDSINSTPGKTITKAIDDILDGKIKLLWIVCTNPAVTLPNLKKVHQALSMKDCFVIVQDAYYTDSCDFANVVLPALQWGEKSCVMTNSERVVSYQEKLFDTHEGAMNDWEIFCECANRLKFRGFDFRGSIEIFEEFKTMTKDGLCDISTLSYDDLPYQWGGKNLYSDNAFAHKDGKARFTYPEYIKPNEQTSQELPFILTTGRTKNQWHTMSKTALSPELLKGEEAHFVLISDIDAKALGIRDGDSVLIFNTRGEVKTVARIGDIKKTHLFMPFGYPKAYGDIVNTLMSDDCDPISFEPELKLAAVGIKKEQS